MTYYPHCAEGLHYGDPEPDSVDLALEERASPACLADLENGMTPNDWKILARWGITPDNLSFDGSLDLDGKGINSLPDNMSVGGSLFLSGKGINSLPNNLSVGETLFLIDTGIKNLPDNLSVGGKLCLISTGIKPLHESNHGYRLDRAGNYYHAGCRRFTAAEAIAHWGSPDYPDQKRGAGFVAAVMAEEQRRTPAP